MNSNEQNNQDPLLNLEDLEEGRSNNLILINNQGSNRISVNAEVKKIFLQ